jgi:uncharacterized protein (DUF427 family)
MAPVHGESVWNYPRPPALVPCARRVRVLLDGMTVADSTAALRVLETASPPAVYVPPGDVDASLLRPGRGRSLCEWKGAARYWDVGRVARAAWSYADPVPAYAALRDHLSFYPGLLECYLDDERVRAQAGDFYGGWITDEIAGPFKGEPGTLHW